MKIWKEFRDFAFKGNVIDLAVGVIIGGAFGKIVSALVSDIIMPLVSIVRPRSTRECRSARLVTRRTLGFRGGSREV